MKVFNGRAATDEYMSTHSLTFSTPELTLKKFALWLGEQVDDPTSKDNVPRLMLYIEDKGDRGVKKDSDLIPDINDTFKPSGAVTDMYSGMVSSSSTTSSDTTLKAETKFCIECGSKLKSNSKFCIKCGANQG
jgi:zinc-ribbon domain